MTNNASNATSNTNNLIDNANNSINHASNSNKNTNNSINTASNASKYVIFDLDGTILNTLPDLAGATNHTLATHNFPPRTLDETRLYIGDGVEKLLERAFGSHSLDDESMRLAIKDFKEFYSAHNADLSTPYDGICDTLALLRKDGWRIGVISNKYQQATSALCDKFFAGLVDCATGSREGLPVKPNRAMFDCFLSENSIPIDSFLIFVGDSPSDKVFADNCKMAFCGVTWGFRTKKELQNADIFPLVDDIAQLKDEICRIFSQSTK
ncbi:MAG: HAD hydrolase-like protein [Clostridia bacterium]